MICKQYSKWDGQVSFEFWCGRSTKCGNHKAYSHNETLTIFFNLITKQYPARIGGFPLVSNVEDPQRMVTTEHTPIEKILLSPKRLSKHLKLLKIEIC